MEFPSWQSKKRIFSRANRLHAVNTFRCFANVLGIFDVRGVRKGTRQFSRVRFAISRRGDCQRLSLHILIGAFIVHFVGGCN
jgi:hypothetical protein